MGRLTLLALVAAAAIGGSRGAVAAPNNGVCWTNDELEKLIDAAFASGRHVRPAFIYGECVDLLDLVPYPLCSNGNMALVYYRSKASAAYCTEPPTVVAQLSKLTGASAFEAGDAHYFGGYHPGTGNYVAKNARVAFIYYSKAQDHAAALTALGYMYQTGEGTDQSVTLATTAYTEAVGQSQRGATSPAAFELARLAPYQLGRMYEDGTGAIPSDAKARVTYEKGRDLREPWAVYRLGLLHAQGRGTPQRLDYAIEYFDAIVRLERQRADQTVVSAAQDMVAKVREAQAAATQGAVGTGRNRTVTVKAPSCDYVVKERDQAGGFKFGCR